MKCTPYRPKIITRGIDACRRRRRGKRERGVLFGVWEPGVRAGFIEVFGEGVGGDKFPLIEETETLLDNASSFSHE